MSSYSDRIKGLFRKYGKIGEKTLSPAFAVGCYLAAENGVKPGRLLQQYGLLSERELHDDSDPEKRGFIAKALSSGGSSWALAFLCTKALLPVRVPLTIAITPYVARVLQRRAATLH